VVDLVELITFSVSTPVSISILIQKKKGNSKKERQLILVKKKIQILIFQSETHWTK
jgi:hypothetical protein